jgi:hypothetical protein
MYIFDIKYGSAVVTDINYIIIVMISKMYSLYESYHSALNQLGLAAYFEKAPETFNMNISYGIFSTCNWSYAILTQ